MARVKGFEEGGQELSLHKSEVICYFQTLASPDGTVLHLSTFGSSDRQSKPKSSQSLQLDQVAAIELMEVLMNAFPSLKGESASSGAGAVVPGDPA